MALNGHFTVTNRFMVTPFAPSEEELGNFVRENPFATITSFDGSSYVSSPLPLIYDDREERCVFLGHFALSNPHVAVVRRQPKAVATFLGTHAYVSPSWLNDRTQAPTWHFMFCEVQVDIRLSEGREAAIHAIDKLTTLMEQGRVNAWAVSELGERYDKLLRRVVAFRAEVMSLRPKFKLGQDERQDVFDDMVNGLRRNSGENVASAMCRFRR